MKYLLDTNICISFINGRVPQIRQKMLTVAEADIAISTVTKAEMYTHSAKSQHPQHSRTRLDVFFERFTSLPFDETAAEEFAPIRAALENAGTPIGPYDMQIAAVALANQLILVTHNTREFGRIAGLVIEDWET